MIDSKSKPAGLGPAYSAQFNDPSVVEGRARIGPERFCQSVDDYTASIHSRNGFSRDRMPKAQVRRFDQAVSELVSVHARERILERQIETHVTWGRVTGLA
jgi:hypothetical protein